MINIKDFVAEYKTYPVLFIGTGFSLRYLKNAYTWESLLKKICEDLYCSDEQYLDLKSECYENNECKFERLAEKIEYRFNEIVSNDRNGKFQHVNDKFYELMRSNPQSDISRFKLYISCLMQELDLRENIDDEISELKKIRKNIGSIITTNYDKLIESIFNFTPLIGNDILLSNPYGALYKIHGCISDIAKLIITESDYHDFDKRYELIRAQLLSLFIHNPIIFIGYNIGDINIKKVLRTIFTYVSPNTEQAEKIRKNFLLLEYEPSSNNEMITEHDIVMGDSTIRINKLKTDNFLSLYSALSRISLPVSAMDIRKVQNVYKEIVSGGEIKVMITEDIDQANNSDKILAIGTNRTIQYQFMTVSEMIFNYFNIIEESNGALISLLNKQTISENQYFPIFGFSEICPDINNIQKLKNIQKSIIENFYSQKCTNLNSHHNSINLILNDSSVARTYKHHHIFAAVFEGRVSLSELATHLCSLSSEEKNKTDYKRLICLYDLMKYNN